MSEGAWLAAGLLLGAAGTAAVAAFRYELPLRRTALSCAALRTSDLSQTVPVTGPSSLRKIVRAINDLEADFQEVLLIFAHLARSARASVELLHDNLARPEDTRTRDGRPASEVVEDIEQMQALIKEFRYFRVTVENGTIRDTAITPAAPSAGVPEAAGDPR